MHPAYNSPTPIPTAYDKAALIEDEITELYAHVNAATYRLLELILALDKEEPWGAWGLNSCAHWLNWKCGVGLVAAREKVRVARALEHLPQISECFRKGEVSYSKVRAMTRVATLENEDYLLEIAQYGTAAHVEALVRKYRWVERQDELRRVKKQYAHRALQYYYDEDGSVVIKARLPAEEGALVLKALQAGVNSLWREEQEEKRIGNKNENSNKNHDNNSPQTSSADDSAESRSQPEPTLSTLPDYPFSLWNGSAESLKPVEYRGFGLVEISPEYISEEDTPCTRRADALVRMAETWLQLGPKALRGGDKYQVVIHIDADVLKTDGPGRCELEDGVWIAAQTARRIACDSSVVCIIEDERGDVLDIGRKSRAIPPSIARALRARDQGCRFPGCTNRQFVDGHHIKHWADGGETKLDNLVQLCRTHHRLIHEGGFTVERTAANAFLFPRPDGVRLERTPKTSDTGPSDTRTSDTGCKLNPIECLRAQNNTHGIDITSDTGVSKWDGVPIDYYMAVEGLLVRREPSETTMG